MRESMCVCMAHHDVQVPSARNVCCVCFSLSATTRLLAPTQRLSLHLLPLLP